MSERDATPPATNAPNFFAAWHARPAFLDPIPDHVLCNAVTADESIISPALEPTVAFSLGLGLGVVTMGFLAIGLLRRFHRDLGEPPVPIAATPLHPDAPATIPEGRR